MYSFTNKELGLLYDLTPEDLDDLEAVYFIEDDDDLKSLMSEYDSKGYTWNSGHKPHDYNPWWVWVDADYVIFFNKFAKKIYSNPAIKSEIESTIGHSI